MAHMLSAVRLTVVYAIALCRNREQARAGALVTHRVASEHFLGRIHDDACQLMCHRCRLMSLRRQAEARSRNMLRTYPDLAVADIDIACGVVACLHSHKRRHRDLAAASLYLRGWPFLKLCKPANSNVTATIVVRLDTERRFAMSILNTNSRSAARAHCYAHLRAV